MGVKREVNSLTPILVTSGDWERETTYETTLGEFTWDMRSAFDDGLLALVAPVETLREGMEAIVGGYKVRLA